MADPTLGCCSCCCHRTAADPTHYNYCFVCASRYAAVPEGWDVVVPEEKCASLLKFARRRSQRRTEDAVAKQERLQEALLNEYKALRAQGMTQEEAKRHAEEVFNPDETGSASEVGSGSADDSGRAGSLGEPSAALSVEVPANAAASGLRMHEDSESDPQEHGMLKRLLDAISSPKVSRRVHVEVHSAQHLRVNRLQPDGASDGGEVALFVRVVAADGSTCSHLGDSEGRPARCASEHHILELPSASAAEDAASGTSLNCEPHWHVVLDIEGSSPAPPPFVLVEVELWCCSPSGAEADTRDSEPRKVGSTLEFQAPAVGVEEAEPNWRALDHGGALQVTVFLV